MHMKARGQWISFADLADRLEQPTTREIVSSDFVLNQLHSLIRVPFELISDYCEDFEKQVPAAALLSKLKGADWYWFTRMIRNAISHNFRYDFSRDKGKLPVTWNGITLTEDLHGKPITYETFWHGSGYELFLEMRAFAEALPETTQKLHQ